MSDLISRQAAIDALKQLQKNISGDYTELDPMVMAGTAYIGDCIGELQDMPSAQPEIIRCKDCRNNHWCNIQEAAMAGDNFFCGAAERRTDGCR